MKKLFALLLVFITLMLPLSFSAAMENPVEKPDIKLVVNNEAVQLTDVPLILDGRTLLPLRAALVALGVPNDDDQ